MSFHTQEMCLMECCELNIEELLKQEDEDVCDRCYNRLEDHVTDMMYNAAKEDFHERNMKYD